MMTEADFIEGVRSLLARYDEATQEKLECMERAYYEDLDGDREECMRKSIHEEGYGPV